MENPKPTWKDFFSRIIQRDVSHQVCSNILVNEEETKIQISSLGQETKNLRSEPQEHLVSALESSQQPNDNHKGRQNAKKNSQLLPHD